MSVATCLSPPQVVCNNSEMSSSMANDRLSSSEPLFTPVGPKKEHVSPTSLSLLSRVPTEVVIEVFRQMDLQDAFSLAATNKRFAEIFATSRTSIVLSIVQRDFTPFNGLLQVVKASPDDLALPWGTWLDKRVSRKNVVLCPGGTVTPRGPDGASEQTIRGAEATLEDADIDHMLAICRIVRGWERIFPQHRFHASPLLTRSLTEGENLRLRRALFHWMRYSYFFHGNLPRPNVFVPAGRDVRVNQLRALPNSELGELKDLWRTVEDIVELTLCPSIDNVRMGADSDLSEKDAARIGWGDQRENLVVVATVCKLPPGQLLHYVENVHKYTKARLVADIRRRHPDFEFDTESLGNALSIVSRERWREMQMQCPSAADALGSRLFMPVYTRTMSKCCGGILDWQNPLIEACYKRIGEMDGLGLDWGPEELLGFRPEIPPGLLDTGSA